MKKWFGKITRPSRTAGSTHPEKADPASLPLAPGHGSGIEAPRWQSIIEQLHAGSQLQLDILRQALNLSSAVLLWAGPTPDQLSVYSFSGAQDRLLPGPYRLGTGVTGAVLKERSELLLAPISSTSPKIPCYRSHDQVGSLMVIRLPLPQEGSWTGNLALLCLDRSDPAEWSASDQQMVRLTAEKLAADAVQARALYQSDREQHAYRRAFEGLQKLNAALGLNSAFEASARAIRSIVPADFIGLSLAEGKRHRIAYVEGENAPELQGQSFPIDQGLVGKVLKYSTSLPENADYNGTSPVFSPAHLFAEYRSLMIVPLKQEGGGSIGALIVASRQQGKISSSCRTILELVAAQVTVKIDLAHAHEQINRLATIDSLTGIANRRAYQRGFEAMLERARRQSTELYIVLCDIDHFKGINDRFGHPVGDEVLRQVAKLFDRVVRTVDLAARTGGEEFAILLEDTDKRGAWKAAERLREFVEALKVQAGGQMVPVTISLGIAAFPGDGNSLEKLVSCADKALYRAKETGRNRTLVYRDMET